MSSFELEENRCQGVEESLLAVYIPQAAMYLSIQGYSSLRPFEDGSHKNRWASGIFAHAHVLWSGQVFPRCWNSHCHLEVTVNCACFEPKCAQKNGGGGINDYFIYSDASSYLHTASSSNAPTFA